MKAEIEHCEKEKEEGEWKKRLSIVKKEEEEEEEKGHYVLIQSLQTLNAIPHYPLPVIVFRGCIRGV